MDRCGRCGSPVPTCLIFQAYLIPASLSAAIMRYAPEVKKSPTHLLKKFAVCDIPLYDICDYNITRDRCKDLGCCFYKGVCYEKAVPVYVQVFSVLIVLIAGVFIVAITYRVIQESTRETEISMEPTSSYKTTEEPELYSFQEPESFKLTPPSVSYKKETDESQVEAEVTFSEHGETEE
ncbi:testis-expressed protein 29 isoform X1 [Mesocricetus auratus]|uniref:Testis-expressed protein 29 isoform X1 n=2 Tax=Mesocricetus auratus TaxID=10036 RepID=A0ABM2WFC5_MESAU|nr:testis-expressed protein 29 isoform X1 [Mesocricetus auratus]